ncbi:MAG: PASTA domain-containing protein [Treponema sp.]|nr:PASTA domain-containing protein [Treponema sp.]
MAENEKKEKKSFGEKIKNFGISFMKVKETLEQAGSAFVAYTIALFVVMGIACVLVFLAANKGEEKVLVPDVVGTNIYRAQLMLQERELYPKLQLRYSDLPGQAGQIISQSPKGGTIVKAGRRVTLVVSRGIVFDHVGKYIGSNIDAIKTSLDALYAGAETPSLTIAPPIFKMDASAPGTILEQDPPEGTPIAQPIALKFVVSSGSEKATAAVPDLKGKTLKEVYAMLGSSRVTFEFTPKTVAANETAGVVVSQEETKGNVAEYSRVKVEFAVSDLTVAPAEPVEETAENAPGKPKDIRNKTEGEAAEQNAEVQIHNGVYGVFEAGIAEYPYPVPVKLEVVLQDGAKFSLVGFEHIGGHITIPYQAPRGSTLVLSVLDREVEKVEVQ